jgi:hypothetical protein
MTDQPVAMFINSYFYFFFLSSVPVLSAISGYLFFKEADYSVSFYLRRYWSRVRSIVLPMVSWNAIALALSAIAVILFPASEKLISYDVFNLRYQDFINALLGLTRHPVHFQFWFLHDLFLTVLCAPLMGIIVRRIPWIGLACVFTMWILNWNFWSIFFRADVFFFFYIGAMARIQGWSVATLIPQRVGIAFAAFFASMVALRTFAPYLVPSDLTWGNTLLELWNDGLRLLGLVALWGVAPLLANTHLGRLIAKIGVLAFFLHAIHWPFNQLMKKWFNALYPGDSDLALLVNFFGAAFMSVAFAIAAAWVLNAVAPKLFNHLSGGRSRLWSARTRGSRTLTVTEKVSPGGAG